MRCSQEALTRRNADCGAVAGFYKSPSSRTTWLPTLRRAWSDSPPGLIIEPAGHESGSPKGLWEGPLQAVVSPGRAARVGASGESAFLTGVRAKEGAESPGALGLSARSAPEGYSFAPPRGFGAAAAIDRAASQEEKRP